MATTYAAFRNHESYDIALKTGNMKAAQKVAEMAAKQAHLPEWFVKKYPYVRLFGSSLQGNRTSDIDLAVIDREVTKGFLRDINKIAWETGRIVDVSFAGYPVGQGVGGYIGKYVVNADGCVLEDTSRDEFTPYAPEDFFGWVEPVEYDEQGEVVPLARRFRKVR